MADMRLGWNNVADVATLSSTGVWSTTMPLANLQDMQLGVQARSINLALGNTQLQATFATRTPIEVLAFANHNFQTDAKYRVRSGTDPTFATWNYDGGWKDVWPAVYGTSDLEWEDPNWFSGKYQAEEIAGLIPTLVHLLPAKSYDTCWLFEFDDHNNPAGYIQIGRLFMARATTLGTNMSYGATLGWQDDSEVVKAISGATFSDNRTPYRVATFTTPAMTEGVGLAQAFELTRRMGVTKEVLFIWDPDDIQHATRRQFIGRLSELSPLEFPEGFINGSHITQMGWKVEERVT